MNEDVSSKSFSAKMSSSSCFFQGRYKCKDNDNYEEYLKLMSESQELALELMMSHAQIGRGVTYSNKNGRERQRHQQRKGSKRWQHGSNISTFNSDNSSNNNVTET